VKPFEARERKKAVPAHALSKSSFMLADTAQRSRRKMTAQQNKRYWASVATSPWRRAGAPVKKESAALLKKHHLAT
jgi:hypothetical protein